jgi:acyl-CoA reductase-like NAD-dependent aldehyde dehydrogenase
LIPALTCGNAVVWKPGRVLPAIGDALARLFVAGGLPDGVLNVVQARVRPPSRVWSRPSTKGSWTR